MSLAPRGQTAVLYCASCQKVLSTSCLLGTHRTHRFLTLEDGLREQLEKLTGRVRRLEPGVTRHDVLREVSAARHKLESVFTETKDDINAQIAELWTLLKKNQEQALCLLDAEKKTLDRALALLEKDGSEYEQKLKKMMKDVQQLTKQQKKEKPKALLDRISALQLNLETMEEFYSSIHEPKNYCMRLRALENSVKKIVQKNKEFLPRPWEFPETITFSKFQKHKDLEVLKNGSEVSFTVSSIKLPKSRMAPWCNVLATQSFRTGRHYWELEVGGSQSWAVGVVEQGWEKKGLGRPLGRDRKSWVLESDEGTMAAHHGDNLSMVRDCSTHRMGVFVDCDEGQVKFYNVFTGCMLHSFTTNCKKAVYPAFSLRTTVNSTALLRICTITQDTPQNSHDLQPSENTSSEGPDSGASTSSLESAEPLEENQ